MKKVRTVRRGASFVIGFADATFPGGGRSLRGVTVSIPERFFGRAKVKKVRTVRRGASLVTGFADATFPGGGR